MFVNLRTREISLQIDRKMEVIHPARDKDDEIFDAIKNILEARHDDSKITLSKNSLSH